MKTDDNLWADKITKIVYGDWISYEDLKAGKVEDTDTEEIDLVVEFIHKLILEAEREAVRKAFQVHHKQYPNCPPKLLERNIKSDENL